MRYISTRNSKDNLKFTETVLSSIASDGGLYVPESYPDVSEKIKSWEGLSYCELAFEIISLFVGDELDANDLKTVINKSYADFRHEDVAPLKTVGDTLLLELFHGPTFAFKDFALRFLGNLFDLLLDNKDIHMNLLGATSGDTGSAAIHSVKGKARINIFILHPEKGISYIQKLQMTGVREPNVFNIGIDGGFDQAQKVIKDIFSDTEFCKKYHIGSINSINWGRILAQIVYYFYAGLKFMSAYPGKKPVFSVPTGNFGNIFAGYAAYRMGLPVKKLLCCTNANNIMYESIKRGKSKVGVLKQTFAPSMDIQIASNFERLIFEISGRDKALTIRLMESQKNNGQYEIPEPTLAKIQDVFDAEYLTDAEILDVIEKVYHGSGYVADPHTAIGIGGARKNGGNHHICLGTAHYAKFPDIYQRFKDIDIELPPEIKSLYHADSFYKKLPPDKDIIKNYIVNSLDG